MKKFYGLSILATVFTFLCGIYLGSLWTEYQFTQNVTNVAESTRLNENTDDNYQFKLAEKDGYVVIYDKNETDIFEYTDISIYDLPEDLQKEILNGKYLKDEGDLYDFLEAYTS